MNILTKNSGKSNRAHKIACYHLYMSLTCLPGYYCEERPWGGFERIVENEKATVKILRLEPNKRFSLQKHTKREEFWRVIVGSGTIEVDGTVIEASIGTEAQVPIGAVHRATGGPQGMQILEITTGEHDENDIVRLDDDFGRA